MRWSVVPHPSSSSPLIEPFIVTRSPPPPPVFKEDLRPPRNCYLPGSPLATREVSPIYQAERPIISHLPVRQFSPLLPFYFPSRSFHATLTMGQLFMPHAGIAPLRMTPFFLFFPLPFHVATLFFRISLVHTGLKPPGRSSSRRPFYQEECTGSRPALWRYLFSPDDAPPFLLQQIPFPLLCPPYSPFFRSRSLLLFPPIHSSVQIYGFPSSRQSSAETLPQPTLVVRVHWSS